MRYHTALISTVFLCLNFMANAWQPAGNRLMTTWGESLNPDKVWETYPRPIMQRQQWKGLNGLMTYDRKVVKVDEKRVRESNKALINSLVQKHQ